MSNVRQPDAEGAPGDSPDWLRRDFAENPAFLELVRMSQDDVRRGRLYTQEQILRELEIEDE